MKELMKILLVVLVTGVLAQVFPFPDPGPTSQAFAPWVIPALIAIVGAVQKAKQPNRTIYEQGHPLWPGSTAKNPDAAAALNINAGSGGGGGSSQSTSNSMSTTISDMLQTPFLTPEYAPLGNTMKGIMEARLRPGGSSVPGTYLTKGISGINDTYDYMNKSVANRLSGLGQLGSAGPAAAGFSAVEAARGKDIAGLRANIPLMERDYQNQDLGMAAQLAQTFGLGQKQHSTSTTRGTNTTTSSSSSSGGGPTGPALLPQAFYEAGAKQPGPSFLDSIAGILGFLYATGAFGGGKTKTASTATGVQGDAYPALFGATRNA